MKKTLIGRKKEIKVLENALASDKPEFVAIVGRRRIGKTFLVKETYGKRINFELTGLQYADKQSQIQNFIFALQNYCPDFDIKEKPKSWLEAFYMLSKALEQQRNSGKKVVFLDELPWLGTKRSNFIMGLSWFWNSWAVNQNIVVVICGSAASWMIEKVINHRGGLHNRVTRLVEMHPFTLGEVREFMRLRKIRLSEYHITQLYMVMGGVPMYLDQIEPGLSAVQNIKAICFEPGGYLRKEFDRLFDSLFDNADKYVEIIRALASKRMGMTRDEIIAETTFNNGGGLTTMLNELSESGFIDWYPGYGKRKQLSLYRLTDPYSLFYLNFIEPLVAKKQTIFDDLSDLPNFKTWSGYTFENICLTHTRQIRKALRISGYTSISSFFAKPKDGLKGAQIDLLIDRSDNAINLCEIKYSTKNYTVTKRDVENLQNKKTVFAYHTKTKKHIFTTIITTHGVTDNAHRLNHIDQVVTLKDLFE